MDPPQALSEKRNSSCSASWRRWVSEAPGAKGRTDPKPQGLWRDPEEDNGTSGAPSDLCDAGRGPGNRRSGGRRRHHSATKDREEGAESARWEGRAGHKAQADAEEEPRGQAAPPLRRGAGARRGAGPALPVLRLDTCQPAGASHPQVPHIRGGRGAAPIFLLSWLWDLSSARANVRTWGQQLWRRMVGSVAQAGRILHSWGTKACWLLRMLCTLLLPMLGLGLARLRLCWCSAKGALLEGVGKLGGTYGVAQLLAHLDAHFLHRTWTLFKETRTCKYVWDWLRKGGAPLWDTPKLRTEGLGGEAGPDRGAPSAAGGCQSGKEVARLLAMAEVPEEELDPFQVLGLEVTATDAELKKAYRRLAVLVHPDKNEHPRAEEAFKVLRAAWDLVSNPEKRKEYEFKRMAESELSQSMNEFLTKLQDDLKEAMNTMMCSRCQGKHKRFELDRDPLSARYCADCGTLHPAEEGDFWAESSLLGLKITYFAVMDRKVYDITEWAGCQRVPISPNTHRVPYHISFGSRSSGMGGRQRAASKGSPASAADLQDFFSRIFQGNPGPMSNGGFFNPSQPPPGGAATPPKTDGAAPKGDTKPKRRKKVRRPFHR